MSTLMLRSRVQGVNEGFDISLTFSKYMKVVLLLSDSPQQSSSLA